VQALDCTLQQGALLTAQTKPQPLRIPSGFSALAVPLALPLPPSPISAFNHGSSANGSMLAAEQRGGGTQASGHW